jgi:biotin transport system substrate-specific component
MPSSTIQSSLSARTTGMPGSLARRALVILAASLAITAAARAAFPLPFTPVPFTLQPLAVLAVGLLLGPVDGTLAVLAYLAEGVAGLPVFSPTGPGGLLQLLGPTGGYLMSYPVVALIAGAFSRLLARSAGPFLGAVAACTLATILLFGCGAAWLAHLLPASAHAVWMHAVAPFLPGEAIKILLAASLFRTYSLRASR